MTQETKLAAYAGCEAAALITMSHSYSHSLLSNQTANATLWYQDRAFCPVVQLF